MSDGTGRPSASGAGDETVARLSAAEASLASLFEHSPFAIALTRMPEGITVGVNAAFEQLFGHRREVVIGKTSIDLGINDPADRALVAAEFAAGRAIHGFECTRTTSSGEKRVLSLNLEQVSLEGVEHVLTTIDDITEKRRAEEALRESERMYRSIVETTAEGVLIGRPDGVITYVNRQMAEMLGYTVEDLVGLSGLEVLFPGWEPKVLQNRALLHSGQTLRGEMQLRRRDGDAVWTVFSSSPLFDGAGHHTANLTMHTDITDRVRAEQELLKRTGELEAALQRTRAAEQASLSAERMLAEVSDAVIAVDEHLCVTYLNEQAMRQYRADPAAVMGRPLHELYQPEWPMPETERDVYDDLEHDGRWRGEVVHVTRDGRRLLVEAAVSVLTDARGAPAGMVAAIRDATERKEAERVLREREAEAAAIAERNRLARDLHDSVTQALFAASLKAESLTLDDDSVSPQTALTVEQVRRLTRGALAQMRTMLLELRSDPVTQIPIQTLLAQLVEAAQSRVSMDVALRVHGEARLPAAIHEALYRIVQESLNNVARHSRASAAWVDLELQPAGLHLEVGDDGRGFDPAEAGPTSLGLRTMRERAAEAGMAFHVDTSPGGGTVVRADWAEDQSPPSLPS